MGHHFERHETAEIDATPEEIWQAIASGPGIDSWYMGRNEVEPGTGGAIRTAFGGYTPEHSVTEWQPAKRLEYGSEPAPDGRFIAYEFLIEGRDQAATSLRLVTSGFLPGDDWEDEFIAMSRGGELFFQTLLTYLRHFPGRTAKPITAFGPIVTDWPRSVPALHRELGLTTPVRPGDTARLTLDGHPPVDAIVYHVNDDTLGLRTTDGLYRFLKGFHGPVVAGHHIFSDIDQQATEQAWTAWLNRVFS